MTRCSFLLWETWINQSFLGYQGHSKSCISWAHWFWQHLFRNSGLFGTLEGPHAEVLGHAIFFFSDEGPHVPYLQWVPTMLHLFAILGEASCFSPLLALSFCNNHFLLVSPQHLWQLRWSYSRHSKTDITRVPGTCPGHPGPFMVCLLASCSFEQQRFWWSICPAELYRQTVLNQTEDLVQSGEAVWDDVSEELALPNRLACFWAWDKVLQKRWLDPRVTWKVAICKR